MVARISSGANPTGAVYYNEEKVGKGEAERLAIRNYEGINQAVYELRLATIAARLEDQASNNERVSKPTFHASLSLAQGEKPSADDLVAIADRYMDGMGYKRQPYVVYQHFDTDHTHIHIVSVRVDDEGKKLSDSYERERSNTLRQQIEKEFSLQVAERAALRPERKELQPVEYGQGNLKRDLSTVVHGVLKDFTFTTFSQYNQLLGIYNVKATEVSMEGKKPGLVYSVLDQNKTTVGTTFKASSLPQQPTMETVARRMNAGKKIKGDRIVGVRKVAAEQLSQSTNWDEFQQKLSKIGVEVIPHLGKDNNLFGVSFIDVQRRGIYTGSELGKDFTAGSLKTALGGYQAPSCREVSLREKTQTIEREVKPALPQRAQINNQPHNQNEDKEPMHNIDLVRQLLYALSESRHDESDHELKKMFKRSRTPRLS